MFFRIVFDLTVRTWATPQVVKFLFVMGLLLSGFGLLAMAAGRVESIMITADRGGDFPLVDVAFILGIPFMWFFSAVLLRVAAEFTLVVFRISEQLEARR